jgi:hypothetical protein
MHDDMNVKFGLISAGDFNSLSPAHKNCDSLQDICL